MLKIEEINSKEIKVTGKQAGEIFNFIKKLGLKDEFKKMFSNEEKIDLNVKYKIMNKEYQDEVQKIVNEKIGAEEYKKLKSKEKEKFFVENATNELKEIEKKLIDLETRLGVMNNSDGFEILYSLLIDRFPANQDLFFEMLGNLYNENADDIANAGVGILMAMIMHLKDSEDIANVISLFR